MKQAISYIRQQLAPLYPPREIQALTYLLTEKLFGYSKLDALIGKERRLSKQEREEWEEVVARLQEQEPVQYILGEAEFCGHTFKVTPATLIPRPETAELVEWIQRDHPNGHLRILDIGTGSGCIILSLAASLPALTAQGWDISPQALDTARENNRHMGTQVEFKLQDILSPTLEPVMTDVIVSNPPYIMQHEEATMEANVLQWEPHTALFVPNDDPLLFYRAIARFSLKSLTPGGCLYLEINRACGKQTCTLLSAMGYENVELRRDLSGNDRMIKAILPQ